MHTLCSSWILRAASCYTVFFLEYINKYAENSTEFMSYSIYINIQMAHYEKSTTSNTGHDLSAFKLGITLTNSFITNYENAIFLYHINLIKKLEITKATYFMHQISWSRESLSMH